MSSLQKIEIMPADPSFSVLSDIACNDKLLYLIHTIRVIHYIIKAQYSTDDASPNIFEMYLEISV